MKAIAFKSILSATALAVTAGISINAAAHQMDETLVEASGAPTKTVTFDQSELATLEGRAAIEARVRDAAKDVCGPMDYRRSGGLSELKDRKECYDRAVAQAMSQINADQVAAID